MKKKTLLQYLHTSTIAGALALMAAGPAGAVNLDTWNGGGSPDGNWSNGNNWGGVAPVATDSLFFDGSTQLLTTNNFAAGTVFTTLNFNSSASPFTLSGNAVTLPTPSAANYALNNLNETFLDGGITNWSGSVQTISLPLVLTNGHHYFIGNAGGSTMNVSGPVTMSAGASASFSDGNSVNVTGSGLANLNGIIGGWATMSPPTSWASLDANTNVIPYASFTAVAAGGAIASAPASNVSITSSGANVTLASATLTDINSMFCPDMGGIETVDVAAGKILRFGSKGGIMNASRQLGTSRILTIGTAVNVGFVTAGGAPNTPGDLYLVETPLIGNTGNQVVMNSRLTNNGTGPVAVHIFGHISFPAVVHTYSGGTYIHGGRLSATGPTTLGTGPVFVYPGGQLFFNASGTYTNAMFIAGLGNGESTGNGAIRLAARTISGTVTLMADAATANGTISGKITGPGGLIVGAGSGNGVGTLTITAVNDYSGDTTINGPNSTAASTLQMGAGKSNIMPHGAGKGNLFLNGAAITPSVATFDLNATVQTINGLNSTGTVARAIITSSTAGSATLILGDNNANGTFGGTIQNGAAGAGYVGLNKIGTGTQTLSGVTTYTGDTVVNGGKLVFGLGTSVNNSTNLTVYSNATLNVAAICPVTQAGAGKAMTSSNGITVVALQGAGSAVTTPTLNALGSSNYITIAQIPAISSYPAQFTAIKYTTTLNGTLNFGLAGALPTSPGVAYAGYVSNNVVSGSVDFVVTAGPVSLKWAGFDGAAINTAWDGSTTDWKLGNGTLTAYSDGVFANFDDSASNGIVSINQDVNPAGITVSNNVLTYTNIGGSKITGGGSLVKQGPGVLILDNGGANDFSGGISILGGSLQAGINDSGNGMLPAGGGIIDNGNLTYARADTVMDTSIISGTGTLTQNGNGTLNLAGANTFTGAVTVVKGTLQTGNSSALGTTNGIVTVQSGATLDVSLNAINLGQKRIVVSGTGVGGGGALINSSGSTTFVGPNVARVTLAGDTTVGGSGRFDLRSATTSDSSLSSLSTGGNPYHLTVATGGSTVAFGLIGCTVDPALGNVDVRSGILSLEAATTGLGNTASNLTIWPGGTLQLFALTNQLNKVITIGSDGTANSVSATSGSSTIIGPMNITNNCIINASPATVTLNLNNSITGPGLITKIGLGLLTLGGNSPAYTGGIQLNAGNVTLSGTMTNTLGVTLALGKFALNGILYGGGVTNNSASTVVGSGTNSGSMDISGALNPGDTNVTATLTTGGLVLESGATLNYDLAYATTPGGGTNDLIVVNGDLVVNGNTITINPLALLKTGPGNPYRLFNYTGNLIVNSGFSVTGPGTYTFTVDTNTPGQVNLIAAGGPPIWNGGSATDSNWSDIGNWNGITIVSGNQLYFDGVTRLNNTNDTLAGQSYAGLGFNVTAGPFVLNGNPVALAGNVINSAANVETIDLGLSYSSNTKFDGGTAGVVIGGGVTNTAAATVLTLANNGTLVNLLGTTDPTTMTNQLLVTSNANWTVVDNASSLPIVVPWQLQLTAGTLNFGSASSAPNLTSTTSRGAPADNNVGVTAGAVGTLNISNGTLTVSARINTAVAANATGVVNVVNGTLNILDQFQGANSSATSGSFVTVSGGTFNVGGTNAASAAGSQFYVSSRGPGILTVSGTGALNTGTLDVSRSINSSVPGTVNLNGGTISASRVGTATANQTATSTGSTATFNFNGGTLIAAASSATYFQGSLASPVLPITAIVKSGGAIIDTSSNSITFLEPLQHDATLGTAADGGLIKKGAGTLTMASVSTYTGPTVVTNGTLAVNGTLGVTAVTVATNGTLAGTGSLGSNVTVNVGGTIAPAGVGTLGILTVVSNVTLLGTAAMDINATTLTNDVLKAGSITYGGALTVTNVAGTLAAGNSFKLFTSPVITGTFAATNLPVLPAGLGWVTTNLANGIVSIVQTVNTAPTNITTVVSGNLLTLSWPADHTGWRLQVQTNSLSTGLNPATNAWFTVPGSTTVNSVNATLDPANGTVFYRMVYP
jgi:fibronectin-binding autotransporter adhesin